MIQDAKSVLYLLNQEGADVILEYALAEALGSSGTQLDEIDADILAIVGSDRTVLNTLLKMGDSPIPILPISSRGQPDFFFDVTTGNFELAVEDLIAGEWTEDHRSRLSITVGDRVFPSVLNEVAIFAKRNATLIRYSLNLDGEEFWKDGSDGLIIATPTGSTAYSLSTGGPIVLSPASVLSVIPVNSTNPARRPLIVSDNVVVEIRNLTSPVMVEAILDGQLRHNVNSGPIIARRADSDAIFVKLTEERIAALRGKLQKKTDILEDLAQDLPPSAKLVLKVLEYHEKLTARQITEETMLSARTVRHALSILMAEGLVKKHLSLRDSRRGLFMAVKPIERQS